LSFSNPIQAQRAAHILHSRYDNHKLTEAARSARQSKVERDCAVEVDAYAASKGEVLTEAERQKRIDHLVKAYWLKFSAIGVKARQKKAGRDV
jgi:hypothetical protein